MNRVTTGTSSETTVYIAIPDGPRVRGPVRLIDRTQLADSHPGKRHRWHEMLHYGERGTGYAECLCGAIGVPYEWKPRRGSRRRCGRAPCPRRALGADVEPDPVSGHTKWAAVRRPDCGACGHAAREHGDDQAPQWEPACWFLINGTRCPCPGYSRPVEDVPEPVATEHDDFEGAVPV